MSGRLLGSTVGLCGIALAVSLVFLPTHSVGPDPQQSEPDMTPFQLSFWSWGRVAETTAGAESPMSFNNTVQLVYFLVALAVGVAGCLLFALRPGANGRVLGAVGLAWIAAQVVSDLMRREGEARMGLWTQGGAAQVEVLAGGVLQVASALTLCAAIVVVAWRPLVALVRPVYVWSAGVVRRMTEQAEPEQGGQGEPGQPPRVGIATIRDVGPTLGQPAWHSTEGVGFTDDPGSDPERFRPPR